MIASQENINNAKKVLFKGLAYHNRDITKKEFINFVYSEECAKSVMFLSRLLTFSLVKEKASSMMGDNFFYISEKNEAILMSEDLKSLALAEGAGFDKYLSDNGLSSLISSPDGNLKIKFSILPSVVESLGYEWDVDCFAAVQEAFKLFIAPYWLNWDNFDEASVNVESKPGMTVESLLIQLMELGLNYSVDLPEHQVLFKDEMEFTMVDEFPNFKGQILVEWDLGLKILKIFKNDNPVEMKSLLDAGLDKNIDFPNGNSLVSMAFKYKAVNCLDVLLENGVSLWKEPSRNGESDGEYHTILTNMYSGNLITKFQEFQFLMNYMHREFLLLKLQGRKIRNLKEKVNTLIATLKGQQLYEKNFFNRFLLNFACGVLEEEEVNACIISNFYLNSGLSDEFKLAAQNATKKAIRDVLSNKFDIYLLYKLVTSRVIFAEDVIMEGKNLKEIIESSFDIETEIVRKVLANIK